MPSANSLTPWSTTRIVAWSCALIVSGLLFGSQFLSSFRPPAGTASDFLQEWLSAKDYWSGRSIYSPLDESLFLHTNGKADRPLLAWNAHPPVSVLLTLPFGKLDYAGAHLLWNLMTFPLFACAVWLTLRELRAPLRALSILPVLTLTFACYPLYYQISQGQWNCVLAALIVAAWLADRRGYTTWAGVAVGLAASIKLFPVFLFLYFAGTARFRALVSGGLTVVVLHLLAWTPSVRTRLPPICET